MDTVAHRRCAAASDVATAPSRDAPRVARQCFSFPLFSASRTADKQKVTLDADVMRGSPAAFHRSAWPIVDQTLRDRTVLLVIGGGIAAYKSLDLIRRLRERGARVRPIMTAGAGHFVTDLAVGALAAEKVFAELFDREDEQDVGHIRLARECDAVVVAPATANLMARMAHGLTDDLATAVLLATRAPILLAPAMNPAMWNHPATRRNVETLEADGVAFVGPATGEMAEAGEAGRGRMAEPLEIVAALEGLFDGGAKPLAGRTALVTSGPTREPIDPVRYISNHSSGKQGHAIAAALARAGAHVTLVTGPVALPDPLGVEAVHIETAREMLGAVEAHLPVDIGVFVAAVADWRVEAAAQKMKKGDGGPPTLSFAENPDILATVARGENRPAFLVGFAAETEHVEEHARGKLERKGADMIVANDVSSGTGTFGGDDNSVVLVTRDGAEALARMSKDDVAEALVHRIAERFETIEV